MTAPVVLVTKDDRDRTVVTWFESEDGYYSGDPLAEITAGYHMESWRNIRVETAQQTTSVWVSLLENPGLDVSDLATHTVSEYGAPLEPIPGRGEAA